MNILESALTNEQNEFKSFELIRHFGICVFTYVTRIGKNNRRKYSQILQSMSYGKICQIDFNTELNFSHVGYLIRLNQFSTYLISSLIWLIRIPLLYTTDSLAVWHYICCIQRLFDGICFINQMFWAADDSHSLNDPWLFAFNVRNNWITSNSILWFHVKPIVRCTAKPWRKGVFCYYK